MLFVEDLGKTFFSGKRKIEALQDINLEISCGEVVIIIGPNGAGKTTLINILCGLLTPTKGNIIVDGKDVNILGHKVIYSSVSPLLSLGLPP